MADKKRPGTMVYFNLLGPLEALSMEERGKLFTALLKYGSAGEEPASFSGMLYMAWLFVKRDMDQDKGRYSSRCEKNREAAEARWGAKSTEEKHPMRLDANASDECECIQTDSNDANTIQTKTKQTKPKQTNSVEGADAPTPRRQTKFIPPTVEEVAAYCREKGYQVNAQLFVDHYEAGGWMRGNTKIKSWKACVRTWTQRQEGRANQSAPPPQPELLTAANWKD